MPWVPQEKELAALLTADGPRRYEYFLHRVCDSRAVIASAAHLRHELAESYGETD